MSLKLNKISTKAKYKIFSLDIKKDYDENSLLFK